MPKKLFFPLLIILILLGFSGCQKKNLKLALTQADFPVSHAHFKKMGMGFQVAMDLPNTPLKTGEVNYIVSIRDNQGKPVPSIPEVKAEMLMDNIPMIAPTEIKPGSKPGEYRVKTDFEMAGTWTLKLKSIQVKKPVVFELKVQ